MNANRKSRRDAARATGQFSNKSKAVTAIATSGLLVSPMLTSNANALAGPVVTECSAGIGDSSHHNLGWAIDQINNGNGEGQNYGPIGTTIAFDLNAPCVIDLDFDQTYVIAENMTIQGPGEDLLKIRVGFSEGSGQSVFKLDANAFAPTNTTSLDVILRGMTIDGMDVSNDQPLIHGVDELGPLSLELHNVTVTEANANGNAAVLMENTNSIDGDSSLTVTNSTFTSNSNGLSTIHSFQAPVMVTDSTFTDNFSNSYSGAIYALGDDLTVSDSTFTNNFGNLSGAIAADAVTISGTTFDSNHSAFDAGAVLGYGVSSITTSTFVNNYSEGGNAGAVRISSDLSLDASTFNGNWAGFHAGAVEVNGLIVAVNNTFYSNRAWDGDGGAIWAEGGTLQANTFVDNQTTDEGSTLYSPDGFEIYSNIFLQEDDNEACVGTIVDLGANLSEVQCGSAAFPAYVAGTLNSSATVTAAQLDLQDLNLNTTLPTNSGTTKTFALGANSVARDYYSANPTGPGIRPICLIDQCNLNLAPTADQRGVERPQGARNDVGAYEYGVNTPDATCVPVKLSKVMFTGNSAKLTRKARAILLRDVRRIKASGCHTIILNGYTAKVSDGSDHKAYRKMIAKKRNAAVKKYLKKQFKVANYTVKFETYAFGGANPVASNKSADGRKQNRRVEIVVKKLRGINL